MPYRKWAEQGFLEVCEGNVIDYREVKARLIWGVRTFDLREICFDPYNLRQLSTQLTDEGYDALRFGRDTLPFPNHLRKFLNWWRRASFGMVVIQFCVGMPPVYPPRRAMIALCSLNRSGRRTPRGSTGFLRRLTRWRAQCFLFPSLL